MTNFLIILTVAAIVLSAAAFIRREKKKGVKCVGCPHSRTCGGCCGQK
jgi:hypothetical protein